MDQSRIIEDLLGILANITVDKGIPDDLLDKNVQTNGSSTAEPNKKVSAILSSNERRRTTLIANLFAKEFFDYKKKHSPDEKPKTLVSEISRKQDKQKRELPPKKCGMGSLLSLLVGGVALVAAAIPAIIKGLFEEGVLAEGLKIFGKVGIKLGLKMLSKGILKFFAEKALKRIPLVGSLINFAYAYKHFNKGEYIQGSMELVAGIANFVPVFGTTLSLGIDILKAFLEHKGAFDEGGILSSENAWGTIKGWGKQIGAYVWDNALSIPILGGVKRFSMAGDAFKSGKYGEGIKQIGLGLISLTGAAPVVVGFEMLYGFLTNKDDNSRDLSPDSSWASRLKGWIKNKLKELPYAIRKPLEWFGIIDESGEDSISWSGVTEGSEKSFESVKGFMSTAWDKVSKVTGIGVEDVMGFAEESWRKTKDWTAKAWKTAEEKAPIVWEAVKKTSEKAFDATIKAGGVFMDGIEVLASKTKEKISEFAPDVVDIISGVARNAMKTLKSIASKIGGWVMDLFTPEDEKRLKSVKGSVSEKEKIFSKEEQRVMMSLLRSSNNHSQWLKLLHDSAKEQVRLLGSLVNINTMSLQELKRISGGGGGNSVNMSIGSPTSSKTTLMSMGDNRGGFASSPYALT